MTRAAVRTASLICAAPIEEIWKVVTDTDRMGRALGFDKIEVTPVSGGAARFHIRTRIAGLAVEYLETPFEWQEPTRFASRRTCSKGPLRRIVSEWTLARRSEGGTQVDLRLELEPASSLLSPLAGVAAAKSVASQMRALREADERLGKAQPAFLLAPSHPVNAAALERARTALRGLVEERLLPTADRLVELVREGADPDVGRIRPFELARRLGADRRDTVGVCLHAVQAGLLDMLWDVVCPSCRTASERRDALADVAASAHCQLCELDFGIDLDRAVEATFRPAASIRMVDDAPLCISGAARQPHVVAQQILPAGGEATLFAPPAAGRYRLFLRGGALAVVDVDSGGARNVTVSAGEAFSPAQLDVAPGAAITLVRPAGLPDCHAKLERVEWASLATTAHFLGTLPTFRRQFSGQLLQAGLSLKVARASILFSDLTASTALYTREGDAVAFRVVQEHFGFLIGVVEAHRGALVKTIGDAIMAVFDDEADAMAAAIAMLRAFADYREREAIVKARGVELKLGLHAGACYVVTANHLLDYFGQSVNLAARLQGLAEGGEIVVSAELADAAERAGWLPRDVAAVRERFHAKIKGLDAPVSAARISLA